MPEDLTPNDLDLPSQEPGDMSAYTADPAMLTDFIVEVREHLTSIEEKILHIESTGADSGDINAAFRVFHTIKGLAGFLELSDIQQVAHEVETLLDLGRSRKLASLSSIADVVLQSMDFIRAETDRLELVATSDGVVPEPAPSLVSADTIIQKIRATASSSQESSEEHQPSAAGDAPSAHDIRLPETQPSSAKQESTRNSSLRVETAKLDHLMNMIGELVIAQTLISHNPRLLGLQDSRLTGDLALLTRVTTEVQRITTSMRMVPIGTQFHRTARLIRDLSRQVGKRIALSTVGEETELDKTIAEELADPLLHMVRNSIDHGIEIPEQRIAVGKDPTANIRLAAYHTAGQIVVQVSDDGRGLDRNRILAKATERGLVRPGAQLTDTEVYLLIFEPGFSTAEAVTGLSGRGVGMDVVKKHVEKLRGRIDIQSEPGKGATFFLRLPLTLAIIEGLVVCVGDNRYIVPMFSILEILRPDESSLSTVQGNGEMATVRGILLPIVRLHERFNLVSSTRQLTEGMLIVSQSEGKRFCLFVDDVLGKQEVVIKTLGATFKDVAGLAGCAVLSDGRVGLILDVHAIYRTPPIQAFAHLGAQASTASADNHTQGVD
ncbi:chemotaxis protein CheA [Granulicella aggregans]|uniref:chemotaxis protein CheA n=1 Tax=Granulicella aggregans TaxID=474949 RepID=UPI0021DFF246|nr:chemotaxis protein CheA [Granulicella aggregans]